MSQFGVRLDKEQNLLIKMEALNIRESDLIEKFIRAGGKGGQKVDKTSSCVYLKHIPTGIELKVNRERAQGINRFLARRQLVEMIEKKKNGTLTPREIKLQKIIGPAGTRHGGRQFHNAEHSRY